VRPRPTALLLDLDGVLRRFDPAHTARVEKEYGLPAGRLADVAFAPDRLRAAVLGRVTHRQWMDGVATELGEAGPRAVADWQAYHGEVDPDVLAAVREVRAGGVPVGLATNATDRLDADLAELGLESETDAVLNSSVLGQAKPSAEFFAAACDALDTPARQCLLVDDSDRMVRGARAAGLAAIHYTGPAELRYLRAVLLG
jgi:putative hydrolase of the HAD superfamily